MSKSIYIRDGAEENNELVIVEDGEVFAVIPVTDRALLDFVFNVTSRSQDAWQRLRQHIQISNNTQNKEG